ncbi:Hypothetical predicted protein [Cloeon dipterum]|uniref:Uncharacterized protein n=1 Tax=Cloeon dipterum TaxID=197152 RepID=A0A8S1CH55_9INSE|nr:Hypothetical predicted protein [Cloeon dipterum]
MCSCDQTNTTAPRTFFDADNNSVILEEKNVLCNFCVLEAKITSPLRNFSDEPWAHDYYAVYQTSDDDYSTTPRKKMKPLPI